MSEHDKKIIENILEIQIIFSNEINQMILQDCNNLVLAWANQDMINFKAIYNNIKQQNAYIFSSAFPIYTLALLFCEIILKNSENAAIINRINELNSLIDLLDNQQKIFFNSIVLVFTQQSDNYQFINNSYIVPDFEIAKKELTDDLSSGIICYYLTEYFANSGNSIIAEKYGIMGINNLLNNMYLKRIPEIKIMIANSYMLSNRFEEARTIYFKTLNYKKRINTHENYYAIYLSLLICSIFDANYKECEKWYIACKSTKIQNTEQLYLYKAIYLFLEGNKDSLNFINQKLRYKSKNIHNSLIIDLMKNSLKNQKSAFEDVIKVGLPFYKNSQNLLSKKLFLEVGITATHKIENSKATALLQNEYINILKAQLKMKK